MLEIIGKIDKIESNLIKAIIDNFFKVHNINKNTIVELKFSTADEMRGLNKKYLHNDAGTDVLSFPQSDFPSQKPILGTICISKDEIRFGNNHIMGLVEHGLFHLIGYDHDLNFKEWQQAVNKYEKIY